MKKLLFSQKQKTKSPFDVSGIKTKTTTQDILDAIKESKKSYKRFRR